MSAEAFLLKRIADKYERSAWGRGEKSTKRVTIDPASEPEIRRWMEDPDEKRRYLAALKKLKREGILDYRWERNETDNLVKIIWLEKPEKERIRPVFERLGRIPKQLVLDELLEELAEAERALANGTGDTCAQLLILVREMSGRVREKHAFPAGFSMDRQKNRDVCRFLAEVPSLPIAIQERVLSSKLYNDSKYLEHNLLGSVTAILKQAFSETLPEELSPAAERELLFSRLGIERFPELLEFAGNVTVVLKTGESVDFSPLRDGASISAGTVLAASSFRIRDTKRVLFIENRTNYWEAVKVRRPTELIVYHGGVYSPVRGLFFSLLAEGAKRQEESVSFLHWSDIDLGGFRIFVRLRRLIPEAEPYRMDEETLLSCRSYWMEIKEERYRKELASLLADPAYAVFEDVIRRMLAENCRLEQENLIRVPDGQAAALCD